MSNSCSEILELLKVLLVNVKWPKISIIEQLIDYSNCFEVLVPHPVAAMILYFIQFYTRITELIRCACIL